MKRDTYEVLRFKDFRFYLASRFFLTLALNIQAVAIAWQVFEWTKDPLSLGLIGLAEVLPAVSLALVAGHWVDSHSRRLTVILAETLSVFVILGLFFLSSFSSSLNLNSKLLLAYSLIVGSGVARAFLAPGMFALLGQILPKELYVRGASWSTTTWQTAATTGPAVAGVLYAWVGASFTYLIGFGFGILAITCIFFCRNFPPPERVMTESFIRSLSAGLRFVFQKKIVLSAISLDLFAVLFGGAVALLPMMADLLNVGPEGLGMMRAAPSVGAILMSVFCTYFPPLKAAGKKMLISVAGFGICIFLFGLSESFAFSVVLLTLSGAFDAVSVIIRASILQIMTPHEMRGRVSAVNSVFISSSNELGAFESGVTAKWMGLRPAILFGGVMTLSIVGLVSYFSKDLRKLDLRS